MLISETNSPPLVAQARGSARRLQQWLTLVMVIAPVLGVVLAIIMLWGRGVDGLDVMLLVGMYVATVLGVEVGLHRHFSHRAFQTFPWMRAGLGVFGSMAAQGPVLFWASVHRRHHAYSDREGDPHSPRAQGAGWRGRLRGLWHGHLGWLFQFEVTDLAAYAPDLLRDRLVFNLSYLYPIWVLLGLLLPAVLGGVISGSWVGAATGCLWGGLVRVFLVHHATWSVNSLCHTFGSRPFRTRDQSTNNPWLMLSSLGGSWHNNHHAFPHAALNSLRWWQLDPSGWLIQLLRAVGLVWDVRVADWRPSGFQAAQSLAKGDQMG
ncbi:MAG TPA: acyl-CoA desaturase [Pirellulales bacterium]|jgi:stearoyl-CoA desaturase (delta-9 desaturase)|nr:acyl-CoA desaturase [Pirellulales bacterium]